MWDHTGLEVRNGVEEDEEPEKKEEEEEEDTNKDQVSKVSIISVFHGTLCFGVAGLPKGGSTPHTGG